MKKIFRISFAVASFVVLACAALSACGLVGEGTWMYSLCNSLGIGGGVALAMAAGVTPSDETIVKGGVEVGDITTSKPAYLADDFDQKLVLIKPSDFPIDTITRNIGNKVKANSMVVSGFELGTRDYEDTVLANVTEGSANTAQTITVNKPDMWMPGDTVIIGDGDVVDSDGKPIALLITEMADNGFKAKLINGNATLAHKVPAINKDTKLIRLSPAVNERVAQIEAWNSLPGKYENYCQIHMTQIEETVIHRLTAKNTNYTFNTMKDQALYDFKMGMERSNLLGVKGLTSDKNGKPVYTSDGLYSQIENQIDINKNVSLTDDSFISICKQVFENNNGADTRIFIAGNELLAKLSNVNMYVKQVEAKNPELVLGVKFNRITTPFGDLLIKPMGSLFTGGWAEKGIIIDPAYIVRKQFEPLQTTILDLDKTAQARVNAVRVLETYCLMLQNKPVHFKVSLADQASGSGSN